MAPMPALPRSTRRELLDGDEIAPAELRRNLRDMAMLNRLAGGIGASLRAVGSLLNGEASLPVLDVGAGSGDFARALVRRRDVRVVVADTRADVLDVARRGSRGVRGLEFVEADARELPLSDDSISVAHASLLMHHLDPPDATRALGEMGRVAAHGVVINDLYDLMLPNIGKLFPPNDVHPTKAGSLALAKQVAAHIEQALAS